jgi:hypothetical protein
VSHNQLQKLQKLGTLERLGHIVSNHIIRRTEINHNIPLLNLICEEEIMNVECPGMGPAVLLTILLQ